jgi:hypothetical protein
MKLIRSLDRISVAIVSALVGLNAIVPGWQIMTSGSVYGYDLPSDWLRSYWPFHDYFLPGLVLLVVIGGGCLLTAAMSLASARMGPVVSLAMGFVLAGWIVGELIFLTQTMIMTWVILGAGVLLIALSAPYALPEMMRSFARRPARRPEVVTGP